MFWTLCEVLWLARNCGFTVRRRGVQTTPESPLETPSSRVLIIVLRLISYNKDPSCRRLLLCRLNTTPRQDLAKSTNYVPWECNPRYRSPHGAETISMIRSPHRVQPGYNNCILILQHNGKSYTKIVLEVFLLRPAERLIFCQCRKYSNYRTSKN